MSQKEHVTMTGMKRLAVVIVLVVLVFGPAPAGFARQSEDDQFTIRVGVQEVNVLFTVTDRNGRLIDGLGPEDFIVEEDGESQQIEYFARENELPFTLALLIDTSPSVREVFAEEKRTARAFLASILRQQDLALVMGFDRAVTLMQDFTESSALLGDAIDDLEVGSGTSVFDAVYLAGEERLQHEAGRKAIILISDGEDTTSRVNRTEALVSVHQADAVVYSISNTLRRRGGFFGLGGRPRSGNIDTLRRLSEETGGAVFELDDEDDFRGIFEEIAAELRSQYTLAYVSTNTAQDGAYREIRIRPKDRDLRVRARRGYYAATQDEQ
jgi:VWFA-related protein